MAKKLSFSKAMEWNLHIILLCFHSSGGITYFGERIKEFIVLQHICKYMHHACQSFISQDLIVDFSPLAATHFLVN